jgi:hypothetical protein
LLVRRARALLQERTGLLRDIAAARDPSQLNEAEVAQLNALIKAQIRQADSTLLLDAFRVRPLDMGRNVFGYEGTFETVRSHFVQRGLTVTAEDPTNGMLRVRDQSGQELVFIRLHAGATGADPLRMPSEADLSSRGQEEVARRAADAYETIRGLTDDVAPIARNTGVPERVIEAVRQHLFLRLYRLQVAPGRSNLQRFDPLYGVARLWLRAYEGVLTGPETAEFRRLMAHEYVEQGLMAAGMPYVSAHPQAWSGGQAQSVAGHFGAHDVAPTEQADPYGPRQRLGLGQAGQPQPQPGEVWDYDAALRGAFAALAARTGGPYRVVADPHAPQGHRIEVLDPSELGTLDARRGTTPATGADPAWNGLRAQLIGRGLSAAEAQDLVALLDAAGRTPADPGPVAALTVEQIRQLLPLDAAGLRRVMALDAALLPEALALCSSPADTLGGPALDALLQRMGQPWVQASVQPGSPNRALLGELGRDALATAARPAPTQRWSEAFSQGQLERILDAPGSGFARLAHPSTGTRISEPGFRGGAPMNMGRVQATAARRLAGATFPDVYGTRVATGQQEAMELKTVKLGETVAEYFREQEVASQIISQQAGRVTNLPAGARTYLVVDIRQSGQTIAQALGDLSTVLRNYGRLGDARRLWAGVRFLTGSPGQPVLSSVYTIP